MKQKIKSKKEFPIVPKLIKTEDEKSEKELLINDWKTMTDEEKSLYL